jgi:hypothetical protein
MTGGTDGVDSPRAQGARGSRVPTRLRSAPLAPIAALALAAISIGAAYLVSHKSKSTSGAHAVHVSTSVPASTSPIPVLVGALPAETGPDGMPWQWIGTSASVQLSDYSHNWLAFRAMSGGLPRTLSFSGPAGEHVTVAVRNDAPQVYLAGPLSNGRIVLRASQPPRAKRVLPPSPSVFLSGLRAASAPVAALPGAGFWQTERAGNVVFNWMRGSGVIDVYAPGTPTGRVSLAFDVRSLGQPRTLTVQGGPTVERVAVTTTARTVLVGPFELTSGRARLVLGASPGPRRYTNDPRILSIQIANLSASASSPKA